MRPKWHIEPSGDSPNEWLVFEDDVEVGKVVHGSHAWILCRTTGHPVHRYRFMGDLDADEPVEEAMKMLRTFIYFEDGVIDRWAEEHA